MPESFPMQPETPEVQGWLAVIEAVNPTDPFELSRLRTPSTTEGRSEGEVSVTQLQAREARIAKLSEAQKAVTHIVTHYLPLADTYENQTGRNPSPHEEMDRAQVARESLVMSAWSFCRQTDEPGAAGQTFENYATTQMVRAVADWETSQEGRFFVDTPRKVRKAEGEARTFTKKQRTHQPNRWLAVTRFVEVRTDGLSIETLEDDAAVTPPDPTFDAAAADNLFRLYHNISKAWPPKQREAFALALGLFGDHPYYSGYEKLGLAIGVSGYEARAHFYNALNALRHPKVVEVFEGYVQNDTLQALQSEPKIARPSRPIGRHSTVGDPIRTVWKSPAKIAEEQMSEKERFQNAITMLRSAIGKDPAVFRDKSLTIAAGMIERSVPGLEAKHIEAVWNTSVASLVYAMHKNLGDDFKLERIGQLFSYLLRDTMKGDSVVQLQIPYSLSCKLDYVGAWITKGSLIIRGNVRDYAGAFIGRDASVTLLGMSGEKFGFEAQGIVRTKRNY